MKKLYFYLLIIQALVFSAANAQTRVTGSVADSTGEVIVGATIVEKGTSANGTSTNASGTFAITLRGTSGILVISNVGYQTQEVRVGNRTALTITLKGTSGANMEEVVVVGYGRQKRITTTGAISTISGKEIRDNPAASLQNTLAGRLPGFFSQQTSGRPGADGANFYIRGISSYNGNNQPLIIVDDIEFTYDQFARIDPNEVESLSILKDASTTAIYGVRGANGVMVVTTRRGKLGPPQISFRTETSISQPTKIPDFLNAYETASLYNKAQINDNASSPNPTPNFQPFFSDADLAAYRDGTDPYGHPDVDWKNELFRKFSRQSRANLDIAGGTEKVKYFISAGYLDQGGILKNFSKGTDLNSNFYNKRYNYRSNLDIKVTNTTDLRIDLYGNIAEINVPNVGSAFGYNDVFYEYSSFLSLAPFAYPIYNPDGSYGYSNWQRTNPIGAGSYNTNNIVGRLTLYGYTSRTFESNMNVITNLNQKLDFITKGLAIKGTVAYTSNYAYARSMTRNEFPSFIYNPVNQTYEPRSASIFRVRRLFVNDNGTGGAPNAGATIRKITAQAFITYDRTFNNRHHVYGLVMYSQNSNTQFSSNTAYNFVPNNFLGLTGRVGYDYRQKYLIEFNGARNGSDRFSKDKRYGFFPAGSIGWNVSQEDFFKNNIKVVDRLKLRGSYGLVGNDQLGSGFSYFYQQTYNGSGATYFGQTSNTINGIAEGTLGNPNVTWEKEKKLDLGIEMGMFKNKLGINLDYFNNNRFDILTTRGTVSNIFGQSLPPVNLGRVNNRGYEIEITYGNSVNKDLSYNLKGSYSYAKNKILFQDEAIPLFPYQAYTGNSIGMQRVYTWIGFYKDSADIAKSPSTPQAVRPGDLKYADINGDGTINGFDSKVQGFPNVPNTTAGIQLAVRYKGFNIGLFFQGSKNFNVRGVAEAIRAFSANLTEVHTKAWTPELGDNAKFPRLTFTPGISDPSSMPSTFWFIRGDYIRLKTAEIGYSLPKRWIESLKMKDIRVYSNGYNIFTWTKLSKLYEFDPEIETNRDRVNYPPQRTFNFGVSATF
ncbi:TonB-dependent receptor [Segetibacter sp. 3557_3]|uniref:SusC/RagA family TonB-linked outer membrane protein n=1 Tax=Segetibacter sp. 3557_3 TaxID=2547429 RepID=UPI0010589F03|nr:TonB-dependent receptor [Segetibacter sp. 3557_3]TDH24522.1 TonB-dependent receptor [Segetibacter sp. 3557_3]